MKRTCLDCGQPISGRSDKKFCSDQCRNNYNNHSNADSTNYMRNVNNILRKNRRILAQLNPTDKIKLHKERLQIKGFNFNYFTNTYVTKNGTTYFFCYEYGYLPLPNDFYFLVKKGDYIE